MTTRIFQTWVDRLVQQTIPHHQVIQLVRTIVPLAHGERPGGKRTSLEASEARDLIRMVKARVTSDGGIRATPDNEERGRDWLYANRKRLGLPPADFRSILEFRLVGFHPYRTERTTHYEPIWRCLFPDGSVLDYAPGAWQRSLAGKKGRPDVWWRWHIEPKEDAA